jgi:hypothetical protein
MPRGTACQERRTEERRAAWGGMLRRGMPKAGPVSPPGSGPAIAPRAAHLLAQWLTR